MTKWGLLGMTALLALAACELETVNVPSTSTMIELQGVLNVGATVQFVLLERVQTGLVNAHDTLRFNAADPIASDNGIPVSGASVDLIGPTGQAVRATEDKVSGRGTGMYRLAIGGSALIAGGHYMLRVLTAEGEQLSAETTLPNAHAVTTATTRPFNRDHDTLALSWPEVPNARAYSVRVETPYEPYFLFTDSTRLRLTGDLRNLFSSIGLSRVFLPGFRQTLIVSAVDSNFYDYYRTGNDPFTGSGLINRVKGGIGMFGSVANVVQQTIDVSVDLNSPVEGSYTYLPAPGETGRPAAASIKLYIESPPQKAGYPAALSGSYVAGSTNRTEGLIGAQNGTQLSFALLANQLAHDTVNVFTGAMRGDSLVGAYRSGASAIFLKVRP
jgi:hypothetical protein